MFLTPYHARYYAALLTRRTVGMDRYLPALASSGIDLHSHQIDAAVFASRSPYRDGVILADEEGLGKTVEAGIVLLQAHLEGRGRLLVLCPPGLTTHWKNELADKFSLPLTSLDAVGSSNGLVILSFQKAAAVAEQLAQIPWDQCVLDEAHQLASANLGEHAQATAIRNALHGRSKLLLTATPMQNSLLDLYHLVRFIDDTIFLNDPEAFRGRYMTRKGNREELAERAQMLCQRTLRRQVLTMPTVRRTVKTVMVGPSTAETALSQRLSMFFHRERLASFPKVEEHRIRITYWKMLASSPQTLAESLRRLIKRIASNPEADDERRELEAIAGQAEQLGGSRAEAFLAGLDEAMGKLRDVGAPQKAVVFSEYRTTLDYLAALLTENGYCDRIALCHDSSSGKKALTAFARGKVKILLATDGGATGRDFSHCALVVNYDLPWNVQKLEQRISRCHRYGQKHDVLVLNFIDPTNRADRRLYDSINRKLKKFDDVFGASETVLGQVGEVDAPLVDIRDAKTIAAGQAREASERDDVIQERMAQAEVDLLAHFDEEVRERFRRYGETVGVALSRMEDWLWHLTRYRLDRYASFNDAERRFVLDKSPYPDLRLSRIVFGMGRSLPAGERYHFGHSLARRVLADCMEDKLMPGRLTLRAMGGFSAGLCGEIGVWLVGMSSYVMNRTELVLCGIADDGRPLDHEECAAVLKLDPLACDGGSVWHEGEGDTYRGRTWRNVPNQDERQPLRNDQLDFLRDKALEAMRKKLAFEQDGALQEEVERLELWVSDEETAIRARQEELRRRIDETKGKAATTSAFVQRFRTSQKAASLADAHRREDEKAALLKADMRRKRDERLEQARQRSVARFWDEELFVAKFRVADTI